MKKRVWDFIEIRYQEISYILITAAEGIRILIDKKIPQEKNSPGDSDSYKILSVLLSLDDLFDFRLSHHCHNLIGILDGIGITL